VQRLIRCKSGRFAYRSVSLAAHVSSFLFLLYICRALVALVKAALQYKVTVLLIFAMYNLALILAILCTCYSYFPLSLTNSNRDLVTENYSILEALVFISYLTSLEVAGLYLAVVKDRLVRRLISRVALLIEALLNC
jgi:hypothetical protein